MLKFVHNFRDLQELYYFRMSCSEQSAFHGQTADPVWFFSELLFQNVAAKKKKGKKIYVHARCCTITTVFSEEILGSESKKHSSKFHSRGRITLFWPQPILRSSTSLGWKAKSWRTFPLPPRESPEPALGWKTPRAGGGKIFSVLLKAREATKQIRMDASRLSRLEPYNYVLRIVTCVSFSICSQLKE